MVSSCTEPSAADRDATQPRTFAVCDESTALTANWAFWVTIPALTSCRSTALGFLSTRHKPGHDHSLQTSRTRMRVPPATVSRLVMQ